MLRRIDTASLRIGMFVHAFCGAWTDNPFWRSSFKIDTEKELRQARASSVRELWIDLSKGLDVDQTVPFVGAMIKPATNTNAMPRTLPDVPLPMGATFYEEIARAAKVCAKGMSAVSTMFQEARMGKALDTGQALQLVEEISASIMRNADALISLARLKNKDDYTYMHSVAVCALMIALARQLKLSDTQTRDAGMAGLLHDIGKMMIPPAILNKPGKLTDAEFLTVKDHPMQGYKMLMAATGISDAALEVCLHHHEKIDGSGYPHQLAGDQISLFARMGAVCDVYDAITSNRAYKAGWEASDSIRRMTQWSGTHFDPEIFAAFVKCIGIYPTGTLVKLKSDRLGVVVEQSAISLLTPKVKVFFSIKAGAYITPEILDFSKIGGRDKILGTEDAGKWGFKNLNALWLDGA